ncbi:MAG TPA: FAD-dependent oxidoreductase [Mycobacteriales bacterium]|nr:FAD-dependent oxidoreductase [Mycobacteriales bacterium]
MTGAEAGLRVAVIGAGPAGVYVADALCSQSDGHVEVDIYDRLPAPFGLLRYGVAPDHVKMKNLASTLQRILEHESVRFFGNVSIGTDVTIPELLADYHAIVYAYGASIDRKLGIPGEDLPGSIAATAFVNWYSGHPDFIEPYSLEATSAVVIGLGNVAIDVARVIVRDPEEMATTDVPDDVLAVLRASTLTDVHIVGRRGPEHAKFTIKELREMGELAGVDVIVDPAQVDDLPDFEDKDVKRNVEVFKEWAHRPLTGAKRRLHMHFHSRPAEIVGTDQVEALRCERPDGSTYDIPAQLVFRSVGYIGTPMPGVPFDETSNVIPSDDHRVRGGTVEVGEYICGWIGRGATGVIGTNRSDAKSAVTSVIADTDKLLARDVTPGSAVDLLRERGVKPVLLTGWNAIDAAEIGLGTGRGNARVKLALWEELLTAAAAQGE